MIFSHLGSTSFPTLSSTASWHILNVTWTTWNSPDNLKTPRAFSLCWCRTIVWKVLPASFEAHLTCFTDNVTCHTQSYIVFMAKSSLAQLYCIFLETRNWFLLHLLSHQHAQHVASFQSTLRQAFHNGRLSQLRSYKDGWGTASALLGFSCELVRMTRKLVTIQYKEHSGGICKAREDLFLEVWLRMGK